MRTVKNLVYTLDFSEIGLKDVVRVGGKNASLGELFNSLKPEGVGVIDGFATTADAYRSFLAEDDHRANSGSGQRKCVRRSNYRIASGIPRRRRVLALRRSFTTFMGRAHGFCLHDSDRGIISRLATAFDLPDGHRALGQSCVADCLGCIGGQHHRQFPATEID